MSILSLSLSLSAHSLSAFTFSIALKALRISSQLQRQNGILRPTVVGIERDVSSDRQAAFVNCRSLAFSLSSALYGVRQAQREMQSKVTEAKLGFQSQHKTIKLNDQTPLLGSIIGLRKLFPPLFSPLRPSLRPALSRRNPKPIFFSYLPSAA